MSPIWEQKQVSSDKGKWREINKSIMQPIAYGRLYVQVTVLYSDQQITYEGYVTHPL